MHEGMRVFIAFLAATVLMAVAGTIAQTQFVLGALEAAGATVSFADRLAMTAADLIGFAPLYAVIVALGFLLAFALAALLLRRASLPRIPVFALAGAACIALMLVLMREVFFGIPLIAGARTAAGVLAQIACGATAGLVFAILSRRERPVLR